MGNIFDSCKNLRSEPRRTNQEFESLHEKINELAELRKTKNFFDLQIQIVRLESELIVDKATRSMMIQDCASLQELLSKTMVENALLARQINRMKVEKIEWNRQIAENIKQREDDKIIAIELLDDMTLISDRSTMMIKDRAYELEEYIAYELETLLKQ